MARPKLNTQIEMPTDKPLTDSVENSVNVMAALEAGYAEERDLLNQLLGQAQMAEAFAKFSKTVLTSKMAFVKENKLYQQLKGKKNQDGLEFSGTWAEFCNLLGYTPEHANESIANIQMFGEEALESMSRMGIGYRELRQFRKLPDDQKTALIEVAESGDKESLLELAEEMIAKQAKEKEALSFKLDRLSADLEASRQLTADKESRYEKVFYEKAKLEEQLRTRVQTETPDETTAAIRQDVTKFATTVEINMRSQLASALSKLNDFSNEHGIDNSDFLAGIMSQLELTINQLRDEYDIKSVPNGSTAPDWITAPAPELEIPAHIGSGSTKREGK